jgi:hypothetical protein
MEGEYRNAKTVSWRHLLRRCLRDIDKLSPADAKFVRFLNAPRLLAPSEQEIAALREIATKPLRTTKPRSSRRDDDDLYRRPRDTRHPCRRFYYYD